MVGGGAIFAVGRSLPRKACFFCGRVPSKSESSEFLFFGGSARFFYFQHTVYYMRLKKLAIISAAAAVSAASLFGVENVEVVFKKANKTFSAKTVALADMPDGARRLVLAKDEIPEEADFVGIYPDSAVAQKGDDGYFIFSRGEYLNFTRDKYWFARTSSVMPVFGAKTPKETFVAVAKSMRDEYSVCAEVKRGVHKMFARFKPKDIVGGIYEDIVFDFYTLKGKDANYSGMGRKYRQIRL